MVSWNIRDTACESSELGIFLCTLCYDETDSSRARFRRDNLGVLDLDGLSADIKTQFNYHKRTLEQDKDLYNNIAAKLKLVFPTQSGPLDFTKFDITISDENISFVPNSENGME